MLVAAEAPTGAGVTGSHLVGRVGLGGIRLGPVDVLNQADRSGGAVAKAIDDLVAQDAEQIGLDADLDLELVDGLHERREGLLDDVFGVGVLRNCLLYTSDAADDLLCVDLGGRRIIKKKNKQIDR